MTLNISVTDDELGQYYRRTVAIANRLGKSLPYKEVMEVLHEIHDGQFGQLGLPVYEFLAPRGEIVFSASMEYFNPNEFYQNCDGLYVYDGFKNHILPATKTVDSLHEARIKSFDLVKQVNDNDAEIRAEFPDGHVFEDASEFSAHFAGMIESQPNGKEGELIVNGYANIFYVRGVNMEVFAVHVSWYSGSRGWNINAFRLSDVRWSDVRRAFSSYC